ncbi:MAG: M20/M25/M40 family metallo-hydrolase [bacterium]
MRLFLCLACLSVAVAGDVLGIVPDARPADLVPAFRVVGALRTGLLVVGSEGELTAAGGRVLDRAPVAERLFRVYPLDESARAALFEAGTVLEFDGEEYLVLLDEPGHLRLTGLRAMVGPVDLSGWTVLEPAYDLPPVSPNPLVQAMVAAVEPESVLSYVRRLQEFRNRYSTGDSCRAACDWVANRFRAWGCDTVILQSHRPGHAPNVIGVRYGASGQRNPYAIICGHIDSYAAANAPGADDNASGTAAAVEACRVTQGYRFTHDLKFIAWTGEEFGLYGSKWYADTARARGDSILGVINFDMIGYADNTPEDLDLMAKIANPACEPFCDWFIAVADTYTTLPTNKQMMSDNQNSDHGGFWNRGYLALTGIEDFWPTNPHYHTSHDSIGAGYNDNGFCTEVTRAGVAAIALLGGPVPLDRPLVGLLGWRLSDIRGNNDGRWDAAETAEVYLTLRNYGMADAHAVQALVSTEDSFAVVTRAHAAYGDIAGQDTATNAIPFLVWARPDAPRGHVARFDLAISAAESSWAAGFSLTVGPYLVTDPMPDGPRTPARYWAYDNIDSAYAQAPVYDWVEIRGLGTRIDYPQNDDVIGVDLPPSFGPFRFYGTDYTRLSVSADGWICPGVYSQRHYANRRLPDPQNPPGMLCPNWDDLYPGYNSQGYVYWYHDEENHRFIVQYDSVAYYSPSSVRDKFQVIIYDTTAATPTGDNVVVFQYQTANRSASSTMGIQDPIRAIAIEELFDGRHAPAAAPREAGRAVKYTTLDPTAVTEPAAGRRPLPALALDANPVRGRTEVRFALRRAGPVRLAVYDRAGRLVAELADGMFLAPGDHSVEWRAERTSRGVYFLRLSGPDCELTAKAIVVD